MYPITTELMDNMVVNNTAQPARRDAPDTIERG